MQWFAIHDEDGVLVSTATDVDAEFLPDGLMAVAVSEEAMRGGIWNEESRCYIARALPAAEAESEAPAPKAPKAPKAGNFPIGDNC